jgi:2-C-methyl-D-erythritol 4-phosphate cytidylyltransferase/2-C-methyl-D-erythritol 2,4-cyclodiphosphate synthase
MPTSPVPRTAALIVAAGRGHRFGASLPKQYLGLSGISVLRRTVEHFARHPAIGLVQVVIAQSDLPLYDAAMSGLELPAPVTGGATRQRSVLNGLEALAGMGIDLVAIHDAARPLVDAETIARTLEAAGRDGVDGALAAVPLADTLKRADGETMVSATVPRRDLWRAQTPQVFRFERILAAHRAAAALGDDDATALTDDSAVAERAGYRIALVESPERNFKITTNADFARAERELALPMETRTGTGFDVHAFGPGDSVTLCGVLVPYTQGLAGHSDADVALHALTDALLGTIGAGDIGMHFPPADPQWRGASSDRFLRHAADLVTRRGGRIVNLDVTIICERPKVGPHRELMRARVAEILGIAVDRVAVKATTTERLGFTGRGEGIAAQAIATVVVPVQEQT